MPERDVLEPDRREPANDAREPADALGDDRVPLVRHRRRALLAAPERLLDLPHLGPGEMSDLEREPIQRGRKERERREELGVAIALEDLGRARRRLEAERLACDALDLWARRRVGADRAGELAHAHACEGVLDPLSVAGDLERPAGELEAEGRRLGVDSVGAADREGVGLLLGPPDDDREGSVDPLEEQAAGLLHRERECGVDDVRGGQAVVEPAAVRAEVLGDGVDERREVVVGLALELGDPSRARNTRPRSNLLGGRARNRSDLRPGIDRRELHREPALERRLLRPDARHRRPGVAWDHWSDSSRRGCASLPPALRPTSSTRASRSGRRCGSRAARTRREPGRSRETRRA